MFILNQPLERMNNIQFFVGLPSEAVGSKLCAICYFLIARITRELLHLRESVQYNFMSVITYPYNS